MTNAVGEVVRLIRATCQPAQPSARLACACCRSAGNENQAFRRIPSYALFCAADSQTAVDHQADQIAPMVSGVIFLALNVIVYPVLKSK